MRLTPEDHEGRETRHSVQTEMRGAALQAAREAVLDLRSTSEIGDDAFHLIEEELDWLEMAVGRTA